jgi:hypothetical protein
VIFVFAPVHPRRLSGAQGVIHRPTQDVDLLLLDTARSGVTTAAAELEAAVDNKGWSHQRVIDQHDFVRLEISEFDPRIFASMIASIDPLTDDDLPVEQRHAEDLRAYFLDWVAGSRTVDHIKCVPWQDPESVRLSQDGQTGARPWPRPRVPLNICGTT